MYKKIEWKYFKLIRIPLYLLHLHGKMWKKQTAFLGVRWRATAKIHAKPELSLFLNTRSFPFSFSVSLTSSFKSFVLISIPKPPYTKKDLSTSVHVQEIVSRLFRIYRECRVSCSFFYFTTFGREKPFTEEHFSYIAFHEAPV